jgi:hypothetical protein
MIETIPWMKRPYAQKVKNALAEQEPRQRDLMTTLVHNPWTDVDKP